MKKTFPEKEVEEDIRQLHKERPPGLDGMTNEML